MFKTHKDGFIATTAIILLATGTLAFMITALSAAVSYADSVERREVRIQKNLNERACQETLPILVAKDHFLSDGVILNDLGCIVHK